MSMLYLARFPATPRTIRNLAAGLPPKPAQRLRLWTPPKGASPLWNPILRDNFIAAPYPFFGAKYSGAAIPVPRR